MSVWRQVAVVLRKEVIDAFRDRRALASIVIGALVGPDPRGLHVESTG